MDRMMTRRRYRWLAGLCLLSAFLLVGCKKAKVDAAPNPAGESPRQASASPKPSTSGAESKSGTRKGRSVGQTTAASETRSSAGKTSPSNRVTAAREPAASSSKLRSSDQIALGKQVYESANCARCHAAGSSGGGEGGPMAGGGRRGGGGRMGAMRGPDLSRVGAKRTRNWLVEHIRDPKSHNPQSRMPAFGDRLQQDELLALAEYLASLR